MYSWFNRWEWGGLAGLANAKGQGWPAIPPAADQEQVECRRAGEPPANQGGGRHPVPRVGQIFLPPDAEAFFKKGGGNWLRFRHGLKAAQDPDDYADRAEYLGWVQELEKAGHVDVFYGNESGFCLTSAIPYGWQFPGEQMAMQPIYSQRFNVLGLFKSPPTNGTRSPVKGPLLSTRATPGPPPVPAPPFWCLTTSIFTMPPRFKPGSKTGRTKTCTFFTCSPTALPQQNRDALA